MEKIISQMTKLFKIVNVDPKRYGLRFKLADNYLSSSETEKGFNEFLKIFEQDPTWNDDAAKKNF